VAMTKCHKLHDWLLLLVQDTLQLRLLILCGLVVVLLLLIMREHLVLGSEHVIPLLILRTRIRVGPLLKLICQWACAFNLWKQDDPRIQNWNFNAAPDSALSFRIHTIVKIGARAVQIEEPYPGEVVEFCRLLSAELMQQLQYYMPNLNYKFGPYTEYFKRKQDKRNWWYSYEKHGYPTGMSPREYFSVAIQVFRDRVPTGWVSLWETHWIVSPLI
ncbi:ribosomal protein S3, partial [Striga asiatica]